MSKVYNGVCAIIRDKEHRILVENHVKIGGLCLPGGKQQKGEDSFGAIERELYEELGISVDDIVLSNRKYYHDIPYPAGSGSCVDFDESFFSVISYDGTVQNREPDKHTELLWLSEEELLKRDDLSDILKDYLTR